MNTKEIKPATIVAHDADFHADDICAVATLAHLLGGLENIKVFRSRDEKIINSGDFVVDVGGVHDPAKKRFDHHQIGGAGKRENGIPYAAFGLVWKEYGEKISGSKKVADIVDARMVSPIDADDNGFSIITPIIPNVANYRFQDFLYSHTPTWKEKMNDSTETTSKLLQVFTDLVAIAYKTIGREIKIAQDLEEAELRVSEIYESTEDKRLIVLDESYPWRHFLGSKPEPLFVVYPGSNDGVWRAKTVSKGPFTYENRKDFPHAWAGLRGAELAKISGVPDAIFCHRVPFTVSAGSKDGAIAMARIALES